MSEMRDKLKTEHVDIVDKAFEWGDDKKIAEVYEIVDRLDYVQAQTVLQLFTEYKNKNPAAWLKWNAQHYIEEPTPFNEWIKNPDFTGRVGQDFWPVWQEEIATVCEPKNGIVEWYITGAIGGGKCISHNTLVQTDRGFVKAFSVQVEDVIVSESGPKKVLEVHDEGLKKSIRFRTKSGAWDENTPHHRHRAWVDGELVWVRNNELVSGTVLVRKAGDDTVWGSEGLSKVEAEIVGLWVADGHYIPNLSRLAQVRLTTDEASLVENLMERAGQRYVWHKSSRRPTMAMAFWGTVAVFIRDNCVTGSKNKKVPMEAVKTRESACAFLRGYFSGDGGMSGTKVEATSVSWELLQSIQTLLWCLGVKSTIRPKKSPSGTPTWRLTVSSRTGKCLFMERIGFLQEYKNQALEDSLTESGWRDNDREIIPGVCKKYKDWYHRIPLSIRGKRSRMHGRLRSVFSAGLRGSSVTKKAVRQALSIPEVGAVADPLLQRIVEEDWWFDTVEEVRNGTVEMVDFTIDGDPSYVANGFISHNTYSSLIAQLYKGPYICSCLKNPQRYFGIADGSEIVFGLFNAILTLAVEVDFKQMAQFVKESPWFRDHCPAITKKAQIHWPTRHMTMRIGSSEMHALGANLFSYMVDEVNFMKTPVSKEAHDHQAYKIYYAASRRLKSRFQKHGFCPGLACIVSSRLATTSFLEKLMEDNKDSPQTYVTDFSMWDAKGRDTYSPGDFRVACGSKYRKSEVLDEVDTKDSPNTFDWVTKPGGKPVPEGMKCVRVPNDFILEFLNDMNGSLRDIAGLATHGISSLIYRTEAVLECVDTRREHPFLEESHELSLFDDNAILVNFMNWRKLCKITDGNWIPHVFPDQPRFCHIDLGLTGDCCGIAVGCAYSQFIQYSRDIETGQPTETFMPKVYVDFMLRVKPTKGEQIDLQKIIDFILNLRNYGYWVQRVTFDGFASEMPIQSILKANLVPPRHMQQKKSADEVVKLESYVVSVDRTDAPYRMLRDMVQANAINYYHYQPFIDEILELEHDVTQTAGGNIIGKVDHPDGGSKDVSDAIAGMVWGIATAKTPHGSEPTEGIIGDYRGKDTKQPIDEQLNADIVRDYADPARIKAIMNPTPTAAPPPRPAGRKKILTRADWQKSLKPDGFGVHRP